MKRSFTLLLISILLLGVIFSNIAIAEDETVLKIWSLSLTEYEKAFLEKFDEEHSSIKVKHTTFDAEKYKTQVKIAAQSGEAPDVFHMNIGTHFWDYVDSGVAMDLTKIAERWNWNKRVYNDFLDAVSRDGKLYGVPFRGLHPWQALFYNKDFFEKNNIELPKTIDDLVNVSKKIKENGMQPLAIGNKRGWPAIILLGDFMLQQADPSIVDKLNSGQIKWTESDVAEKSLKALVKLAQNGVFAPGYKMQSQNQAIQTWAGQRVAMLYNGTWWTNITGGTDLGFQFDVISLPKLSSDFKLQGAQLFPDLAWIINSNTEVEEAAIKLVDHLTSNEYNRIIAENHDVYTPNPQVNEEGLDLHPAFAAEPLAKQFDVPKITYFPHVFPIPVFESMKVQIQKAIGGQISIEKALQVIEKVHAKERAK